MFKLSPNNRFYNILPPIITMIFFGLLGYNILTNNYSNKALWTLLVIFGLIFLWFFIAVKSCNFYYDKNFLILKRLKSTERIPYKDIIKVKMTLSDLSLMGLNFSEYRIEYLTDSNKTRSKKFWSIVGGNERLNDFESFLQAANPLVEVEHFASTFDQ